MVLAVVDLFMGMESTVQAHSLPDAVQCVETLVDLVQGPCKENQAVCISAKLLNSVVSVLSWERGDLEVRPVALCVSGVGGHAAGVVRCLFSRFHSS